MSKTSLKDRVSPAITYPEPIEFANVEDFIDAIASAIGSLEGDGADLLEKDALAFLKELNSETVGQNFRWLGDMLDRNLAKFEDEIAVRESDDGVDFIEDGAAPTDEPDFIDPTQQDDDAMHRARVLTEMNEGLNSMMDKANSRIRGNN